MSRKHKFYNREGLYFVSFATVYWFDVFTRDPYFNAMLESLDHCRKNKGMELYMVHHAKPCSSDLSGKGKRSGQLMEIIKNLYLQGPSKVNRRKYAGEPKGMDTLDDGKSRR
ncbi:hypothetical protein GCM10009122_47950 [Fulvivirga kasyanovii]|uniref:hypothetical protein n=1 Tax=Fulvivirga kasyanovii TaxID=396812 RepID=UPI0031B6282F